MGTRARICCYALILISQLAPSVLRAQESSCAAHIGQWLEPNSGDRLQVDQVLSGLSQTRILLLGESHTSDAHHRWQHYMLAALHSRRSNMMIGFEMLPRKAQAVLNAWSAGDLDEQALLEQSDWRQVWGYDAELYLPLLHFARQHRLPSLALNVDRELVSKVGRQGWQSLDEDARLGLSDPAPASDAYRQSLARLYAYKQSIKAGEHAQPGPADLEAVLLSDGFSHFVDAQLTWDRAMAEALAAAHRRDPAAVVVGIVGRGHLEYGYGIPHQLADMGIEDVDVLLPLDAFDDCDPLPLDLATAVFIVDADAETPPAPGPRLGVVIENHDDAVRVMQVVDGSVAARSDIRVGDRIVEAAGFATTDITRLIEIIQRQAPGTWLPLTIERAGKPLGINAKFPQEFE